ncbi:MAG: phosphatidate cytidylyltransferase [Candidatus Poribacteria bacterium]|nr:phosphatidate cytidylyltransferase [Candidatus Poribacteria bacterium]
MFWRRALSVVVLVPLILLIVYFGDQDRFGGLFYLLLVSAAVLMMQIEYCRLAENFGAKLNPVLPAILTVAFCLFAFFLPTPIEKATTSLILFSFFVVVFIYAFASSIFRGKVAGELLAVTLKLTGILTIGWSFGYHCILLRKADDVGMQLIFLLIGTIWCSDTGAYLIGRAVGKHKLSTPISPRKTVEGTIAGFGVGTLVSMALGAILLKETLSLANAALIGLLLSILGQLGDLSVSLMKRTAGVKDSGDVIPGHGGFLDRCDSLIFSAPSLYYYLALTGVIT